MSTEAVNIPAWPSDAAVAVLREMVACCLDARASESDLGGAMVTALEGVQDTLDAGNYLECAAHCGTLASLAMALQIVALVAAKQARER